MFVIYSIFTILRLYLSKKGEKKDKCNVRLRFTIITSHLCDTEKETNSLLELNTTTTVTAFESRKIIGSENKATTITHLKNCLCMQ